MLFITSKWTQLLPAIVALASLYLTTPLAHAKDEDTIAAGQKRTEQLYQQQTKTLWAEMTPDMQKGLGSEAAFAQFAQQVAQQLGQESEIVSEKVLHQQNYRVYQRTARFTKVDMLILVQFAFDENQRIAGMFVKPSEPTATAAPSAHMDYQTKANLRLPFNGEWFVVWGGRTIEDNYHAVAKDQRFAYDFLVTKNGQTHVNEGKALSDYHCWNQALLAPADATVVNVVDGLPDQAIGARDPQNAAGNHVVLDFGHSEYAVLAHFQQNSIQVKTGDTVKTGQLLGRCGNSGNTTEPHLHFHLQNSNRFGQGEGLPAAFQQYLADGKVVARGEPKRGQTIAQPE